jgi:hypothetical protein
MSPVLHHFNDHSKCGTWCHCRNKDEKELSKLKKYRCKKANNAPTFNVLTSLRNVWPKSASVNVITSWILKRMRQWGIKVSWDTSLRTKHMLEQLHLPPVWIFQFHWHSWACNILWDEASCNEIQDHPIVFFWTEEDVEEEGIWQNVPGR